MFPLGFLPVSGDLPLILPKLSSTLSTENEVEVEACKLQLVGS